MSEPIPIAAVRASKATLIRHAALFVVGIAIGSAATAIIVNALARRDAYLRGVMEVMQHRYGELRAGVRARNCGIDLAPVKPALAAMAESIEPAYAPDSAPPAALREYAQRLREAVAALPAAPSACSAVSAASKRIGEACEACHREYR